MNPIRQKNGSTIVAIIAVVLLIGVVVFVGLRLNEARTRLVGEIDGLQSELSTAHTRVEELQDEVNAERAARKQAEETAEDAANAAVQARQELQNEQEKLNSRIQELETGIKESEQRVAAAIEEKTKFEAELTREAELRKAAEQEVADIRNQFQNQEALVGQVQGPSETSAEAGRNAAVDARAPTATAQPEIGMESDAGATSAAKQRFDEEAPADASPAAYDTPPKPLNLVSPEYPRSLRREGIEGNVVVAFTVDTRGRVEDVEVQEATNSEFETAAVTAVRKWRFKPALRDGEPVEVRISQALTFTNN